MAYPDERIGHVIYGGLIFPKDRPRADLVIFNQICLIAWHRDCLDELGSFGMGFYQAMIHHFQVAYSQ